MVSVCWGSEGILLVEFLKGGATISSERYVEALKKFFFLIFYCKLQSTQYRQSN